MLDTHTIRIEQAILLGFCAILTFANWRINKGARGMHWFFWYSLALVAATLLGALRGQIPGLYSVVVSNTSFFAAYLFLYLSVTGIVGPDKLKTALQGSLVASAFLAMVYYGLIAPNTSKRVLALSVAMAAQQVIIASLLRPRRHAAIQSAGLPMAAILIGLALTNLVRIVKVLRQGVPENYLAVGTVLDWVGMVTTALQCGTMVAYIWITASLLRNRLEVQASTDPLTGLLNRRAIERFARDAMAPAREAAIITMDLDGFKTINDTLGHACGDQTLVSVARCLQGALRPNDLAARFGGDEFVVLLPGTSVETAAAIADRLCAAIAQTEVRYGHAVARVTASIGLTHLRPTAADWQDALTHCDHALYTAKRAGGNRVVCARQPAEMPVSV